MTTARYLQCSAAGAFLILTAIASVNAAVDPANIFGSHGLERRLADMFLAGKSGKVPSNFDDRRFHQLYAADRPDVPEVLILGSSRMLGFGERNFPGKTVFNSWVTGATTEDLLALFHLYTKKSPPRIVVMGLDPYMLNRNNGLTLWRALQASYETEARELLKTENGRRGWAPSPKWVELISLAYFQESLKRMMGPGDDLEDAPTRLSDGSYLYGRKAASRSTEEVRAKARKQAGRSPVPLLGDFVELDARYSALLKALLARLNESGVRVIIVLAPYHPEVYRVLTSSDAYRNVRASEIFYRRLAAETGAEIVGSYDLAAAGCEETEFYDGMHPKESCMDRILAHAENLS